MQNNPTQLATQAAAMSPSLSSGDPYVCAVEVKPSDQSRVLLGEFDADLPIKGFVIELTPDPHPENSVVTNVLHIDTAGKQKMFLDIANYGTKPINAVVKQL